MKYKILALVLLLILISPASAQWFDSNYGYRTTVNISNGTRPYQLSINLSNGIGTNNATHIFCNDNCKNNFTDINFTLDNTTVLPYWIEDNTTGKVWINITANGTVNMYYGNSSTTSHANGTATFPAFSDLCNKNGFTEFGVGSISNCIYTSSAAIGHYYGLTWNTAFGVNYSMRARVKSDASYSHIGMWDEIKDESYLSTTDMAVAQIGSAGIQFWQTRDAGVLSQVAATYSNTEFYNLEIMRNGATSVMYNVNDALLYTESTQVPTVNLYPGGKAYTNDGAYQMDWFFVRHFQYPEQNFSIWGTQEGFLINSNYNNYTNDATHNFTLAGTTAVLFNVTNSSSVDFFSWFLNGVNQSTNLNQSSLLIADAGINNITVLAENNTQGSQSVKWFVTLPFTLLTPANGSTQTSAYPPLDTPINFSWNSVGYPYYELVISRTPDFSMIVSDTYTTSTNKNVSLAGGNYWWKVRSYNSVTGVWGAYSDIFNFTLTITTSATGRGVDGVVYELIGGVYTPIDQATVYIYNTTWSSLVVTGTNGYYLFSPLGNGTYNIYAAKSGYDTTVVFPATVNGSITTNDILMKVFISPYIPNFVFEKFIVRDLFDRSYVGVTVNVYKGDSPVSSFTGTTDSTGAVVFQLIKDQRYRVTFSGGGISGTITIYVYAKEESYFVRVLTGFPTGGDRFTDISTNLTAVSINATHSYLELIYNDTKASTSIVNFYATNLTTGETCYANSTSSIAILNCTVWASGSYQFGFNATSSIYGFFQEDKVINFDVGKPATPAVNTTVDKTLLQWASIILIVLTAALFSIRTVKYGAVIVPLEALALWAFGWFEPIVGGAILTNFTLLACAVVLGVMIYLRQSEIKVNF